MKVTKRLLKKAEKLGLVHDFPMSRWTYEGKVIFEAEDFDNTVGVRHIIDFIGERCGVDWNEPDDVIRKKLAI